MTPGRWSTAELVEAIEAGLRQRARDDDLEQAVYGFDALDELAMHPLIAGALRTCGCSVYREVRYPQDQRHAKKSKGKRCDFVLTPKDQPLRDPEQAGTLFDTPDACDFEQAYWLEMKLVAQFEKTGPFRHYSKELLAPVPKDVRKLWSDGAIFHAGLLLILLTADQHIAEHDLSAWYTRCLERGYPVAAPATRHVAITDRLGNGCCTVALFSVRG